MVIILDDILKLPFDLGIRVLEEISGQVDTELLRTEESVRKRIMEIRWDYENGRMDAEEYRRTEKELRMRLEELKG